MALGLKRGVCVCSGRLEVSWSVGYMGESNTVTSTDRTKSNGVECRVAQRTGRYRRSGLQRSTSDPALLEHNIRDAIPKHDRFQQSGAYLRYTEVLPWNIQRGL